MMQNYVIFWESAQFPLPIKCKGVASLQKRLPRLVSVANRHKAYSS